MNAIARAVAGMARTLKQVAGRTGVYKQGDIEFAVTATPSEMMEEVVDDNGIGTGHFIYGLLFVAADLVADEVSIVPREGDRFEETLEGVDIAWEVSPKSMTSPVYVWADSSGLLYVVYCKKVNR